MVSPEVKVSFFKKGKSRPTTTSRERAQSPSGNDVRTSVASSSNVGTKSQRDGNDDSDAPKKGRARCQMDGRRLSHKCSAGYIMARDEAEELLAKRRWKERGDAREDDPMTLKEIPWPECVHYYYHLKKSPEVPKAMCVSPHDQRSTGTIRTDYKLYLTLTDSLNNDRFCGWQLDKLAETS
ncbi:hypothetical protein B0H11DRAFT_2094907 [Mycena galericulata]|nr:hypothetical protein B0H11DRAFT_2094907 [Mycena galericulata]